jgi:lysophospholipase L1-like esterase
LFPDGECVPDSASCAKTPIRLSSMKKSWPALAQRIALVALGIGVGLGAAEVCLRLWSHTETPLAWKLREWDPDSSALELLGTSCYRARPGSAIHYPNGTVAHVNGAGYRGPEVAVPKPPGTYRIVVLGGSVTHGFSVGDDQTIDAHLRRALAEAASGRRVEAVNLGLDGLDAVCDLERLRLEGLRLEPDAVAIHTGVNDVPALRFDRLAVNDPERGFRAQRRLAEEARVRERGVWRWLKHRLFVARVPGVAWHFAAAKPLAGPLEPSAAALDAFEATLRALTETVSATTTVMLSTPPSALLRPGLRPVACGLLVVDAATTQRYRDRLDARLQRLAGEFAASGRSVIYVPHTLPDDVFVDDCHLTGAGNRLVAADFAGALAPRLLSHPAGASRSAGQRSATAPIPEVPRGAVALR